MNPQSGRNLVGSIELSAESANWDPLMAFIKDQVKEGIHDSKKAYGMTLAAEELLSNIMRDSHTNAANSGPSLIKIAAWTIDNSDGSCFELEVSDDAAEFDPHFDAVSEATPDAPIEERPIGGLGLFLIKTSVDQVRYAYVGQRNTYFLLCHSDLKNG
jgi:anti-sigma regulatory factor (Ser/Thr protein kinase)